MDDKTVVEMGKLCAGLFSKAWKLNRQIEDEVTRRFGFKDTEDYREKTGLDVENDVLIDALQQSGSFTQKDWKMAIAFQEDCIRRANKDVE